jgi:hypothetical protein
MISKHLQRMWLVLFGLAATLMTAAIWASFQDFPDIDSRPIGSWTPTGLAPADTVIGAAGAVSFSDTLARPLFQPSRRPFDPNSIVASTAPISPPAAAPQPVEQLPPPQFSAKAIVFNGPSRLALIAKPELAEGKWLTTGAVLDGWRVEEIAERAVTLKSGAQIQIIKLYVDKAADGVGMPQPGG